VVDDAWDKWAAETSNGRYLLKAGKTKSNILSNAFW